MPVLALVVTLAEDPTLASEAKRALAADPRIDVGPCMGLRLPVAVSADDGRESVSLLDAIEEIPGVRFVEVVMADYADLGPDPSCADQAGGAP